MIVFLHGVPETADLWNDLRAELDRESIALQLPGFGCATPEGFGATKEEYVQWILDRLGEIEGPIDLVGHDWGALLLYRIATAYGDRLHSWTADVANGLHPKTAWHEFAKIWQTPDEGEAFFANMATTDLESVAPMFESTGISHRQALDLAANLADPVMGASILSLYRSATPNLFASWGDQMGKTTAPGLVLIATEDPFCVPDFAREVAETLGARTENLEGLGHWWAYQEPAVSARVISEFIDSTY